MSKSIVPQSNNDKSGNSYMMNLINKLLGKIFLKKPVFFGLNDQKITLLVSPSMKIYGVYVSPERLRSRFPFQERKFLNPNYPTQLKSGLKKIPKSLLET